MRKNAFQFVKRFQLKHFALLLLLAPLAALHAATPAASLTPYVTSGDPNIGRAFRNASSDLLSNILPLTALPFPQSKKQWDA